MHPGRTSVAAVSVAARTAVRSGPSDSDSGVGTQMTITSGPVPAIPATFVTARKPPASMAAISASDRSSTCDRPAFRPSTVACLMSSPVTRRPARTAS